MKLHRNYLITLAATAVILAGGTVFAFSSGHLSTAPSKPKTVSVNEPVPASAGAVSTSPTPSGTTKPTTKPSATPNSSPTATTAKTTKTPTPTPRPADFQSGACQGIHGADDGCITKNPNRFEVASGNVTATRLVCSAEQSVLTFNISVTRHYLAGGGGDSQVRVSFDDGTSSLYTVHFMPYVVGIDSNIATLGGLTHIFPSSTPKPYLYNMNILSPNVINMSYSSPLYVSCS